MNTRAVLSKKKLVYAVGANIIGNVLEWYEFYLYVLFTPIFAELFFPKDAPEVGRIHTMLIFAIGFLSRPFGVILLGHLGDRIGRRVALLISILMMAIPTFTIGCLPTYAMIGMAAPFLIGVFRLLQGIPTGGEFTGVMCYLYEIAPLGRQGFMASLVSFGAQVGPIFSLIEVILAENFLSHEQIAAWGWRISFILGGLIGVTGWYLRYRLQETPVFKEMEEKGKILPRPVLESLRKHKSALLKAMLLTSLTASGWYLVFIFSSTHASNGEHANLREALWFIVLSTLLLPFFGWFADKGYKKALWVGSCVGVILFAYPFYFFSLTEAGPIFLSLKVLMVIFLTVQFALFPIFLCELFPPPVRYSSVGIAYNITTIFLGGFSPMVAVFLTRITGHPYIPMYILVLTAFLSLFALFMREERTTS